MSAASRRSFRGGIKMIRENFGADISIISDILSAKEKRVKMIQELNGKHEEEMGEMSHLTTNKTKKVMKSTETKRRRKSKSVPVEPVRRSKRLQNLSKNKEKKLSKPECSKTEIFRPPVKYGSIPGIVVGTCWETRMECSKFGVHRPTVAGIHGGPDGAYSIALSGGYPEDVDEGYSFLYTGAGGRDLKGTSTKPKNLRTAPQTKNQKLTGTNLSLVRSIETGNPVRVIRGHRSPSVYAPKTGYRYDGLYQVVKYWEDVGKTGFKIYRFKMQRIENQAPPPWERYVRISPRKEISDKIIPNGETSSSVSPKKENDQEIVPKTETDTKTLSEMETDTETFSETETDRETFSETETDRETFPEVETDTETFSEMETDAETFPEVETDTETSPKMETDAETFPEVETDTETSPKMETDTETEIDTETSLKIETDTGTFAETEIDTKTSLKIETDTGTFAETEIDTKTSPKIETDTGTFAETEIDIENFPKIEIEVETSPETEIKTEILPTTECDPNIFPRREPESENDFNPNSYYSEIKENIPPDTDSISLDVHLNFAQITELEREIQMCIRFFFDVSPDNNNRNLESDDSGAFHGWDSEGN